MPERGRGGRRGAPDPQAAAENDAESAEQQYLAMTVSDLRKACAEAGIDSAGGHLGVSSAFMAWAVPF